MKVLLYVDSTVAFSNCVTAAEMLRRKLDAEIVMMTTDSNKRLDATTQAYTLFDYSNLFRSGAGFVPVWPKQASSAKPGWSFSPRRALRAIRGSARAAIRALLRSARRAGRTAVCRSLEFFRRHHAPIHRATLGTVPSASRFRRHLLASALLAMLPLVVVSRALAEAIYRSARGLGWLLFHLNAVSRRHALALYRRIKAVVLDPFRPSLRLLITYRSVGRLLDEVEPDLIVLAEGNVETLSMTFIAQGRRRRIPTIIVPFTLPNPLEPAQFYQDSAAHRATGLAARLLCRTWPKWRFSFQGIDLLRLPLHMALLSEILGTSSPAPWVLNRSSAAIALDSQAQRDQYLRLGFPASQLHVVGDAQGDNLYDALANKDRLLKALYEVHGFDPGKPLVLCGFPPDQFATSSAAGFEFPDYETLVGAWTSVFRELEPHANFLIRPHPRSTLSQIELLCSHGVALSTEATAELIPLCDLYLASISATIRWAISCGIPVINYDTYRYRYDDFSSAAGVFPVETIDEFRQVLFRLLTDRDFAAEAGLKQRTSMEYWGFSDGKTSDRFAALARKVVDHCGRSARR